MRIGRLTSCNRDRVHSRGREKEKRKGGRGKVTATKFGEVRQGEKTLALEPLLGSAARTQRELDCQETGRGRRENLRLRTRAAVRALSQRFQLRLRLWTIDNLWPVGRAWNGPISQNRESMFRSRRPGQARPRPMLGQVYQVGAQSIALGRTAPRHKNDHRPARESTCIGPGRGGRARPA